MISDHLRSAATALDNAASTHDAGAPIDWAALLTQLMPLIIAIIQALQKKQPTP